MRAWVLVTAALALCACGPAFDWRELRDVDNGLALQFPCKPQRVAEAAMGVLQCEANGARFVFTWKRFDSPQTLQAELLAQAPKLAERMQARAAPLQGRLPGGALAWDGSGRYQLAGGERPAWLQVWARGLTLHQLLVTAPRPQAAERAEQAQQFFDGVRTL
jgi:hypothetical protein